MKKPYKFNHLEFRQFDKQVEIACFNKHGGFRWAILLPSLKLVTWRTLKKLAENMSQGR